MKNHRNVLKITGLSHFDFHFFSVFFFFKIITLNNFHRVFAECKFEFLSTLSYAIILNINM